MAGGEIKIKVTDSNTHRAITKILDAKEITYHTYILPDERQLRVVIRNLPKDTLSDDIANALIDENQPVKSVVQMTRRRNGEITKLPLFLITLDKTAETGKIYDIKYLLRLKIKIERYKGKMGISQCHRCQGFFHSQGACKHAPKCVKCGDDHLTKMCTKTRDTPAKCANCKGDHPASYRSCPVYIENVNKDLNRNKQTKGTTKSYADRVVVSAMHAHQTKTSELTAAKELNEQAVDTLKAADKILQQLQLLINYVEKSGLLEAIKMPRDDIDNSNINNDK